MEFSSTALKEFESIKEIFDSPKSALIPTLYLAQKEFGYLSHEAIEYVAKLLNLTPAKVMEVASFYTMLHKKPVGKYEIQVCLNITCHMMKAQKVYEYIKNKLKINTGETTSDKLFTLTRVECLGACDKAPAIRINNKYHYQVTPEKCDELLRECKP